MSEVSPPIKHPAWIAVMMLGDVSDGMREIALIARAEEDGERRTAAVRRYALTLFATTIPQIFLIYSPWHLPK